MPTAGATAVASSVTTPSARFADLLRGAIVDGRFVPGQRLVEVDLVDAFRVSRGAVREGLRVLATEGLVQLFPNRGAVVRRFSVTELDELFRIREALEGLAARSAAENMSVPAVAAEFRSRVERIGLVGASDSPRAFGERNRTFHDLILELSGNRQLQAALSRLQLPLMQLQVRARIDETYREESSLEHLAIERAIASADADGAEQAMRRHLRGARLRVLRVAQAEEAALGVPDRQPSQGRAAT